MAESRQLNLILNLKDQASGQLGKFSGKLKSLEPQLKKAAIAGTAAFAAISAGVGLSVKEAAKAEGSWNKFNTVFGEGADDMRAFVDDIRTEMPTATHEIARMAADIQDLLVPMGLARDSAQDLSGGFLDVANKISAFNDVDPTEVLNAIKSALAGSSEPLRRFGVDALETSLEARALKEGLIEAGQSFKDLDPKVKNQIRAQALYAQVVANSSDAIEGFEENNDSFIRRQQELNATLKEAKEALGRAFLPAVDAVLKKILPVVKAIADWVEENPKLARTIIIIVGALAGLVAVVATLSLAFLALSVAMAPVTITMVLIGVLIAAIVALAIVLIRNWEMVKQFFIQFWEDFLAGIQFFKESFIALWEAIKLFWINLWLSIKNAVMTAFTAIKTIVMGGLVLIKTAFTTTFNNIKTAIITVFNAVKSAFKAIINSMIDMVENFVNSFVKGINKVINALNKVASRMPGKKDRSIPTLGEISLPRLAKGGIVTKPTIAEIGEAGAEAVIPLDRMKGFGNTNITITGNTFMSDEDSAERIGDMIISKLQLSAKL